MENEKDFDSDEKFEEMFSSMGGYMVSKLKKRTESVRIMLRGVEESDKKNKEEISTKLKELVTVMELMTGKTELQTKTQKELFDLMEKSAKLDNEIDNILKNGE